MKQTGPVKTGQLYIHLLLVVLAGLALIETMIHTTGFGEFDYIDITDVHSVITRGDGSVQTAEGTDFGLMNAGDSVTFTVDIPNQPMGDNQYLCFYQYHSVIRVYSYDHILLATIGENTWKKHGMLGDELCLVNIPDRYLNTPVTVQVDQKEAYASNHHTDFRLVGGEDIRLYPLIHQQLLFLLYLVVMIVSAFAVAECIVSQISRRRLTPYPTSLAFFCFSISLWQMASRRFLYIGVRNTQVDACAEYFAILFAPSCMFFYLSGLRENKIVKRIYRAIALIFTAYFAANVILHFGWHNHISNREGTFYILLTLALVTLFIIEIFFRRTREAASSPLQVGILAATILLFCQMALNTIRKYVDQSAILTHLERLDFASMATLVFVSSLTVALYFSLQRELVERVQNEQNRYLARHDQLTGLYNRVQCEAIFDIFDKHPERPYAILFFDADGLKKANDSYGHKIGDQLIRVTADNIRSATPADGSLAVRWGGDEFLIVLMDPNDLESVERNVKLAFERTNASGVFPFHYSVSLGSAVHYPGDPTTTGDIRNLADERMYQNKKARQEART